MRNSLITLLLIIPLISSWAQDTPTQFSLEEAINFALENNYSAINADRDILDARKQKWEVIATGLPQIDANISYQNQLKQPVSLIPAEFFGGEPGTFQPVVFSPPQSANATATLKQQIFDGSYIVGVQATRAFLSYSQNNKEKTAQEVRKAVVEAYGNVLLARETVAIAQNNIETLGKTLYETQKLFENGLGDEESVEQLQITLASLESSLKNAQRLEVITLQMLNLMMGLPIEYNTILTENLDDLTKKQINPGLLESEFVMENNVDYKLVFNLNEQRYYELKLARSRALPTLNAFVNYSYFAFGDDFNFLKSEQEWFESSVLGVDLKIPLFSSLKRDASTQRAKIAFEKAKTQLTETEEKIRLALDRARSDYIFSIEEYETKKKNLDLAARIENKNQIKYSEGLASSFELRQAQTQLYAAQQEYLQSMVNVINKKTDLETILNN
ncbi:TolC family protein [Lentiprolixibacter aurantiacus]|uniref:TolC family protein n=1 Tax=Lentiprolixibacter aurantiacus TaxID=2993939 RepID=A0AAE3MK76_9FLAO|nr:TolC family protein [Lentiprolixibacter aurantiacus]MCX2718733.1 TolC family protein [Lentiprolixibacter aurantiacus]